jgi:hypothetical protein
MKTARTTEAKTAPFTNYVKDAAPTTKSKANSKTYKPKILALECATRPRTTEAKTAPFTNYVKDAAPTTRSKANSKTYKLKILALECATRL